MDQPILSDAVASPSLVEVGRSLESFPAAAYVCDADGQITHFNRRAVEIWGRTPSLDGDRYCGSFELLDADSRADGGADCPTALVLRHGRECEGLEIDIGRPDRSRVSAIVQSRPLRDEREQIVGAVTVLIDISGRKQAEARVHESDRQKDELMSILAHELRNPLAPIANAVQLLKLNGADPTTLDRARSVIERQLNRMVLLVDGLLDMARIAHNKLVLRKERVELAAVVQTALDATMPLATAAGLELQVSLPQDPIWLDADPTRMAQVLLHLLDNAVKFTARGGRILLDVRHEDDSAVIRVRDTGAGIEPEKLERIFDVFPHIDRTPDRAQGGLGIGLGLVKRLVGLHEGTVEVHSEGTGLGCEIVVRLPVARSSPAAMEPSHDAAKNGNTPRCRILVVEDNMDSALTFAAILRLQGNDVRTAHDGLEALEVAASFLPDVALLDIGLPRLNGYEIARRLRNESWGESIFLVAITSWGQDEDRRRSADAGFNMHMVKPVGQDALESLLAGFDRSH